MDIRMNIKHKVVYIDKKPYTYAKIREMANEKDLLTAIEIIAEKLNKDGIQ